MCFLQAKQFTHTHTQNILFKTVEKKNSQNKNIPIGKLNVSAKYFNKKYYFIYNKKKTKTENFQEEIF